MCSHVVHSLLVIITPRTLLGMVIVLLVLTRPKGIFVFFSMQLNSLWL